MADQQSTGYGPSSTRYGRLLFNGDEARYELWEVKFLAHCSSTRVKLRTTILPLEEGGDAVPDPAKNAECFNELVQVLDDRSLSLIIHDASQDGRKAFKILRDHYKSSGKPRIIALYTKLTTLVLGADESVTDYIIRAESASAALKTSKEQVSDSLVIAMIIKGLPQDYAPFATVILQREEEASFLEFKVALKSYDDQRKSCAATRSSDEVLFVKKSSKVTCYKCKKPGHKSNDPVCPAYHTRERRWCSVCRSDTHNTDNCRKKKSASGYKSDAAKVALDDFAEPDHTFCFHLSDVSSKVKSSESTPLLVDCGCTSHIITDKGKFCSFDPNFKPDDHYLELADGSVQNNIALGRGSAFVKLTDSNGQIHECKLDNALYVPSFQTDIFSVRAATDKGAKFTFSKENSQMACGETQFSIHKEGRLYFIYQATVVDKVSQSPSHSLTEWHSILGHCNHSDILKLEPHVKGMHITDDVIEDCDVCIKGKMTQSFNRKPDERATEPLQLVHCDLAGPITPAALEGFKYALVCVCDFTGCAITYFLKHKSDTALATKKFLTHVSPYGKVRTIRSDSGGEFTANAYETLLLDNQINHETSAPSSPHQNGTAERQWRTLFEMARCMLIESGLPKHLWAYAVMCATYTRNRCYNNRIGKTPIEALTGKTPDLSRMHVFGSTCFAYMHDATKLEARAVEGKFVGYDKHSPAYLVYIPGTGKIKRVRCVEFLSKPKASPVHVQDEVDSDDDDDYYDAVENVPQNDHHVPQNVPQNDENQRLRRDRRPPRRLDDYEVYHVSDMNDQRDSDSIYRIVEGVPLTYSDAVKSADAELWREAMDVEMRALAENETWELTALPEGRTPVGGKWVYTIKPGLGSVPKYKARFVAKGYAQRADIDYHETFSPTAHITSVRLLQQLSVNNDFEVHQMDVKSAYLNAPIDCEIYVCQPEGYVKQGDDDEKLYCKLNKSLYGLKQSGRNWNHLLHSHLVDEGFVQSESDPCLYTRHTADVFLALIVWVDDIIIGCSDAKIRDDLKKRFCELFQMKDLGQISVFLGIEFSRGSDCVKMHQSKFISKVLQRFQMSECKPRSSPCEVVSGTDDSSVDSTYYRQIVGSLIYIMGATRPDISFAVTKLSQHMSAPTVAHLNMAKHVLRYLKGSPDKGLIFTKSSHPIKLTGYCDSDWGGCEDRKSVTGYCFMLSNTGPCLSWKSRKQQTVALSTCEAEYMALSAAVQEGKFLTQLLKDMCGSVENQKVLCDYDLYCDNQGAIALANNPVHHQRSKHIDIRYHYIRGEIQSGHVNLLYIPTSQNASDVFTKAVNGRRMKLFESLLTGSK